MVRIMCDAKRMEKKRTKDLKEMLGLKGISGLDGKSEWSEMV